MTSRILGILIALPALATAAGLHSEMLVSTDWLAAHSSDPNVIVLHVTRDRAAFDAGHIPGARFVALSELVVTRDGVLNELPPVAELKKALENAGVSDNSHVVIYTDGAVLPATRAWFTLDYLGHGDHASLLDGGLQKWRAENRAITKDPTIAVAGHFSPHPRPELLVGMEPVKDLSWVAGNSPSPKSTILLDVRTPEEFAGDKAASEITRPGHIPGAVNVYWMNDQGKDNPALRPEADLRKLYEAAGITPDHPVVTYCNTGMQASQAYFTLKYLGYDTKLYDGSFSEWSSSKGTAVQK